MENIKLIAVVSWIVVTVLFSLSAVRANEVEVDHKGVFSISCLKSSPTFQSFNLDFKSPYRYFQVEVFYQGDSLGVTQVYDLEKFKSGNHVFGYVFKQDSDYLGKIFFTLPIDFKEINIQVFFSTASTPKKSPKITIPKNCKFSVKDS